LLLVIVSACQDGGSYTNVKLKEALPPDTVEVSGELPVFATAVATKAWASSRSLIEPAPAPAGAGVAGINAPAVGGDNATRTDPAFRRATFAFSGDTLTHSPLVRAAKAYAGGASYDFFPMFARVAPVVAAVDYGICHLETPIAPPGEPLSTYPVYGVPAEVTTALSAAGYDRCSTASNHTIDRGVLGIDATVNALEAAGLTQAGMARTAAEALVALVDVNGISVAHLSYTTNFNGGRLPADQPWRSNIIDAAAIISSAVHARARGAEVVIVSLHWGNEGVADPTPFQLEIADQVTQSGAVDLIVGHHAHVIQPIQLINDRWVVFGMGNILSNLPVGDSWPASTQDGMIVSVAIIEQPDGRFLVEQPAVVPTWVDKNNGWVIRPVLTDLVDPTVSNAVKGQLAASLERTRTVVGAFVIPTG